MPISIDLFSDTLTKPSAAMRQAMAGAEVGDEQKFEDPTTLRLEERVAELLGKEAALFAISGTMCNQMAFAVHCRPGDEILCDETSHPANAECAGAAVFAGAQLRTLRGERGVFTAAQVEEGIRAPFRLAPVSRLVSIEQTANLAGGTVWPLETVRAVCEVAHQAGLAVHMDGARLFNAVAASRVPAREYARTVESVWIDLSKGLGCAVGAVLAGTKAFIQEAWRWKQRLGGAMRQSGILAAAGLYALDHHLERLHDDHAHARLFAERIAGSRGVKIDPASVESNIVVIEVTGPGFGPAELLQRLAARGVRLSPVFKRHVRAVTHLDISRAQVEEAARAFREECGG